LLEEGVFLVGWALDLWVWRVLHWSACVSSDVTAIWIRRCMCAGGSQGSHSLWFQFFSLVTPVEL
jgi:hypothetical protein